jgi:dipeptidase
VIREIDPNSPDFMFSTNLHDIAQAHGWWKPEDGLLHFTHSYAPTRLHPSYANRRVWRIFDLSAPDAHLPGDTNPYADDYPFSIQVTRPQGAYSPKDIMWMQRDHYEGTPYSTTEGIASGPYGDPNRWDYGANGDMTLLEAKQGEYQRTISLFRTSYSFVATPRAGVDDVFQRMWLSHYAPDSSTYTPIYIASKSLSKAWTRGTMHRYDPAAAWWNFAVVGNYAGRFYKFAMEPVRALQHRLEDELIPAADDLESSLVPSLNADEETSSKNKAEIINQLTDFTVEKGTYVSEEWRNLFPFLLTTYRDGYIVGGLDQPTIQIKRFFYPRWWLESTGFFEHPGNKDGILFSPNNGGVIDSAKGDVVSNLMTVMITGLIFFLLGFVYSKRTKKTSSSSTSSSTSSSSFMMSSLPTSLSSSAYQYTAIPEAAREEHI